MFRLIHKGIAKDYAKTEFDKKKPVDPNMHKHYILKDKSTLAQFYENRFKTSFKPEQMSKISQLNLDDPDNPINVLRLFAPELSQNFMHDVNLMRNCLPEQTTDYMSEAMQYKFPTSKLPFVYRFMPTSLNEKMLTYCMMPHIQRKSVGQLTKMLPAVLDQFKNLSLQANRDEKELMDAQLTDEQRLENERFDKDELLKKQYDLLRKRAKRSGDVKNLAFFEDLIKNANKSGNSDDEDLRMYSRMALQNIRIVTSEGDMGLDSLVQNFQRKNWCDYSRKPTVFSQKKTGSGRILALHGTPQQHSGGAQQVQCACGTRDQRSQGTTTKSKDGRRFAPRKQCACAHVCRDRGRLSHPPQHRTHQGPAQHHQTTAALHWFCQ